MLIGVDVGGTFTDAVLALDGRVITAKAPTTPDDQSEGVMAAIEAALAKAGADAGQVEEFSHGMTVATNALLEGGGARTAFVATEGFTDVIALGRQDRPQLYRLCAARPAPLAPDDLRFGALERMTPDGPLTELTPEAATGARRANRRGRARGDRGRPAPLLPPSGARAGDRRRARASPPRRPHLALARGRRHVPRVRARRHDRDRRRAVAAARPLSALGSSSAQTKRACPSRRSCSPTAV